MSSEPKPRDDSDRLELLRQTALFDARVEEAFDRTVRLLVASLDISLVVVHFIGERDRYFTSTSETPEPYTHREELTCNFGFCETTAARGELLAVDDAADHPEYADDPGVRKLGARAFAGAPLRVDDFIVGTLCVVEGEPRGWTESDLQILEDAAASLASEIEARADTQTVLVVEDDAPLRCLVEKILRRKGYNVIAAADGPTAVEKTINHDGSIDVALTDVVMPQMGVAQLHERLQSLCPTCKFIFMSGYSKAEMLERGVPPEYDALLEKPFSNAALADKVREVLEAGQVETATHT